MSIPNSRVTLTRAALTSVYLVFAAALCGTMLSGRPDVFHGLVTVPVALLAAAAALMALERLLRRPARLRAGRRAPAARAVRDTRARFGPRRRRGEAPAAAC